MKTITFRDKGAGDLFREAILKKEYLSYYHVYGVDNDYDYFILKSQIEIKTN